MFPDPEEATAGGERLAAFLGKHPDAVSYWVGQGVRRRLEDSNYARRLDALHQKLAGPAADSEGPTGIE